MKPWLRRIEPTNWQTSLELRWERGDSPPLPIFVHQHFHIDANANFLFELKHHLKNHLQTYDYQDNFYRCHANNRIFHSLLRQSHFTVAKL